MGIVARKSEKIPAKKRKRETGEASIRGFREKGRFKKGGMVGKNGVSRGSRLRITKARRRFGQVPIGVTGQRAVFLAG